jgi:hypothetical protein
MKKLPILLVLPLLFAGGTATWPAGWAELEARRSVGIVDAAHYCVSTLGYDFGLLVEAGEGGDYSGAYAGQGIYDLEFDNIITISNASRYSFDWSSSPNAINAVVVQGGPRDNIFYYLPPKRVGAGLYSNFIDKDNPGGQINQIAFCWKATGDNGAEVCYQDGTAWAANGDAPGEIRSATKGDLATHVAYTGEEKTVTLFADRTQPVGTATLSAPSGGEVIINIQLNDGFIFYFDLDDKLEDNNLKVQDYKKVPSEGTNLNLFEWVERIPVGSRTGSITVPENKFYSIHLDLAAKIPCR